MNSHTILTGRFAPRRLLGGLALALLVPAAACSLGVEQPDIVQPSQTGSESALPTVLAGAAGDFAEAFAGSADQEGIALLGALFADEFMNSDYYLTHQQLDRRNVLDDNSAPGSAFRFLQRARASAENTAAQYAKLDSTNVGRAEALNLAGYSYVLLAESWCNGIPVSSISPSGDIIYGAPETTQQIYDRALARFDEALRVANLAGDAHEAYGAMVGRARVLLDEGKYAEAAAAAAPVPTSFTYLVYYSKTKPRENNGIYMWNNVYNRFSVADVEGGNGLPFRSSGDPRAPWLDEQTTGLDNRTDLYTQQKYPDRGSSIPLASGVEARLIEAEQKLQQADYLGMAQTLDSLRAGIGLAPLAPATDKTGAVEQLFAERGYWLFLTGHRMGDLRREVRQYSSLGFTQDRVFPSGSYPKGGVYGSDVNLPIPVQELNNPQAQGCLDRNP